MGNRIISETGYVLQAAVALMIGGERAERLGEGISGGDFGGKQRDIGLISDHLLMTSLTTASQHVEALRGRQADRSTSLRHKRDATGSRSRR